jgi:hypothetical protein
MTVENKSFIDVYVWAKSRLVQIRQNLNQTPMSVDVENKAGPELHQKKKSKRRRSQSMLAEV